MSVELSNEVKDSYVKVSALPTGFLKHPDRWLFEDGDEDWNNRQVYPNFSFLIEHPSGRKVMFDLGMPKNLGVIPPLIRAGFNIVEPHVPEDAIDILRKGNVDPSHIDTIIFSHLHFDHVGDCSRWPEATLVAGPGSRAAKAPGWPDTEKSIFASDILKHNGYTEIVFEDKPVGDFPRSHDFFKDGSLLLLDAPGHMAGHIGAIVKTNPDEWIFMGGDCCHHYNILSGRRPMSITVRPAGTPCFHKDPTTAQQTIEKVRNLEKTGNVLVCLAHDNLLTQTMPQYPESINGWKNASWVKSLDDESAL